MVNVLLLVIEAILLLVAVNYARQKKLVNAVLVICAGGLLAICIKSITDDQDFNDQVAEREALVKARLLQVKTAQEAYKELNGEYANNFIDLIEFVKNSRVPEVTKYGVLSEYLQQEGWVDSSASAFIYQTEQKYGRGTAEAQAAIHKAGLDGFRIDTTWTAASEALFGDVKDFCADSMQYIPFSGGKEFDMTACLDSTRSGLKVQIMACSAADTDFLKDMGVKGKRCIQNRAELADAKGAFAGLMIGSYTADEWNNNAGNWE